MMTYHVQDTANDISIIQTVSGFHCRYGLQVKKFRTLEGALAEFGHCLRHSLIAELEDDI